MSISDKLVSYAKTKVMAQIEMAKEVLRQKFLSAIKLIAAEPQFSPSPQKVSINITAILGELGGRVIRFDVFPNYRWDLVFYIPRSRYRLHFLSKPRGVSSLPCSLVPFAIASFSYVATNIVLPYREFFYNPVIPRLKVDFSTDSIWTQLGWGEQSCSIQLKFERSFSLLNIEINDFHFESWLPYGDLNLQRAMEKIINAYRFSCL